MQPKNIRQPRDLESEQTQNETLQTRPLQMALPWSRMNYLSLNPQQDDRRNCSKPKVKTECTFRIPSPELCRTQTRCGFAPLETCNSKVKRSKSEPSKTFIRVTQNAGDIWKRPKHKVIDSQPDESRTSPTLACVRCAIHGMEFSPPQKTSVAPP